MKKIVVTLMCALLATSLVACSKTPSGNTSTGSETSSDTYLSETGLGDGIDNITGDPATITDVGTAEAVLMDTGDYKITLEEKYAKYTKKETGYNDGMLFSIIVENNTDKTVSFCFKDIKINGEEMLLTEAAELLEIYGTETAANDTTFAGLLVPFQSLYASETTTIESISFVTEIYPVVGNYGELGELLYTSEEITFETIKDYCGDDDEDDEDDEDEEDRDNGYTYNEVTVEEQVLVDDSLLKICTTGDITYEEGYAQKIGLTIENKTDTDLMIISDYVAVNGYNQTTYLWQNVPAGEIAETSIDLLYYDLMLSHIDTIATVEFVIEVGIVDAIIYDPIVIETSAAGYEQPFEFEGTTIYNENGLEIIALDNVYDIERFIGPVFIFVNNTGGDIRTNFENVTINGITVENQGHSRLPSGFYNIRLMDYSDDMYENDIETLDEFECTLTVYSENFEKLLDAEPVSISY